MKRSVFASALIASIVAAVLVPLPAAAAETMGSISGTVTLGGVAPASKNDWQVSAVRYFSDGFDGGVEWWDQTVTKGAGGAFTISNLRAGYEYALVASGRRAGIDYPNTLSGGVGSSAAAEYRMLSPGQNSRSIDVPQGGVMSGTVQGSNGSPISNAQVGMWTAGTGEVMSSFVHSTITAPDGTWSLRLPFGSYRVGFTNAASTIALGQNGYTLAPGRHGLSNQWYQNRPSYDTSPSVRLNAAQPSRSGVNAILRAESPSGGGLTQVDSYIALGDSYQSGEGANPRRPGQPTDDGFYYPNTDVPTNECHRSYTAYPELLVEDGYVTGDYASWACSGAVIADLSAEIPDVAGPPWDDPWRPTYDGDPAGSTWGKSTLDRLEDADPDLVTIGIGGNDMEFVDTLTQCVVALAWVPCQLTNDAAFESRREALVEPLRNLFGEVKERVGDARVAVLGYARFYDPDDLISACLDTGVRRSDQIWINYQIKKLDDLIRTEASAAGFQYVDIYAASAGHELCQGPGEERYMHGIMPSIGSGSPTFSESYHPTPFGHRIVANLVQDALGGASPSAAETVTLAPSQNETLIQRVPTGSPVVTFELKVPGELLATLTSPGGEVFTEDDLAANMEVARTGETVRFTVTAPEVGAWRLRMEVPATATGTLDVSVRTQVEPRPNQEPTARIVVEQSPFDPTTYSFSAADSTDPDGGVSDYLWDFGDGTTATGQVVEHQFTSTGAYAVSLVARDFAGALGFETTTVNAVVPSTMVYVGNTGAGGVEEVRLTTDARDWDDKYIWADPEPVGNQRDPALAPDRWTLAYVTDGPTSDVLTVYGMDGLVTVATEANIADPDWSPDGTRMVFAATDVDGAGIFVVNADGTGLARIADPTGNPRSPAWSPDGQRIAFARSTGIGIASELVSVAVDGLDEDVIGTGDAITSLSWSPSGARLAYAADSTIGVSQIHLLDVATGAAEAVTSESGDSDQPAWHADGHRIAYRYTVAGDSDVWVVDSRTGASQGVIQSSEYEGQPIWG